MHRIILLEPDRILARNICDFLITYDCEVDWHVDPQTAVSSADKHKPDLVILDLMLAIYSGIEFLYEFRSYHDWTELPVILYSNISQRDIGQTAATLNQLNITAFHYKPETTLSDLVQSVRQILVPSLA